MIVIFSHYLLSLSPNKGPYIWLVWFFNMIIELPFIFSYLEKRKYCLLFSCRLFEFYGHEDNIKFVCKEFPLQNVGPWKGMAFSVDFSKLVTCGIVRNFMKNICLLYFIRILPCFHDFVLHWILKDGYFRYFLWPTMLIIVGEPKAHKFFTRHGF